MAPARTYAIRQKPLWRALAPLGVIFAIAAAWWFFPDQMPTGVAFGRARLLLAPAITIGAGLGILEIVRNSRSRGLIVSATELHNPFAWGAKRRRVQWSAVDEIDKRPIVSTDAYRIHVRLTRGGTSNIPLASVEHAEAFETDLRRTYDAWTATQS